MALTQVQRGRIIALLVAVLAIAFVAGNAISDQVAEARGKDLRRDLVAAYRGTDGEDVVDDLFLGKSGHAPDATGQVDGGMRARYRVGAWTESRCVYVEWSDDGVNVSRPKGCTP